ncbi:MAG: restriction endonuclease subunit S [Syntrophaceae bacterium]|nr:restriction endonuclease subunit S [Syntrophaceae bacterium]
MTAHKSKLEQLIDELCPEGVERKTLGEIATIINGRAFKIDELLKKGKYRVLRVGNFFSNNEWYYSDLELEDDKYCSNGDLLFAWSASFGAKIWDKEKTIYHYHIWKIVNDDSIHKKFLFYLLDLISKTIKEENGHGSTMIHVTKSKFEKIRIPIPPLPIQQEIVKILDTFTTLEAELEAELEARKKQYAYYREELLTPIMVNGKWLMNNEEVEWKTIKEISEVYTGGEPPINCTKGSIPDEENKYPIYGNGIEVYGFAKGYKIDKDAVTISSIGANTGAIYFRKAYFTPIIRLKVLIPKNENLLVRFLYHYLSSIKIGSKKSSVPNMNANDVKKVKIPIPPIAEQKRIVNILDKLDALVNDISSGLPAEISARRKQYEYYRDKLLTFKPLEKIYE